LKGRTSFFHSYLQLAPSLSAIDLRPPHLSKMESVLTVVSTNASRVMCTLTVPLLASFVPPSATPNSISALRYGPASPKKPSWFLADFRVSNNAAAKRSGAPPLHHIIAKCLAVTRSLFALLGSAHYNHTASSSLPYPSQRAAYTYSSFFSFFEMTFIA
jgi:hypothetical protein